LFPERDAVLPEPGRREHLTFKANRLRGRHGWLRLTPAYSVHVVEGLVASCTSDVVVLDPFCGTGTTALVCAQQGIACHTVDINPFLVWLANVKCQLYTQDDVAAAGTTLHEALVRHGHTPAPVWMPPLHDIGKWWEPRTLLELAHIWGHIQQAAVSARARDLLSVIFCRAAIECAGVSFGHQSMSFKKRADAPEPFDDVSTEPIPATFLRVAGFVLKSATGLLANDRNQAFLGDARELASALPRVDYNLVVTSPPYPNRMSYIRELRPYMYWLGYLTTGRQAGELDWEAIGGTWGRATSNLTGWMPDREVSIPYEGFADVVARIAAHSRILSTYVAKYFQDIVIHVRAISAVLAPGARVHYVIGNSKFYDVMLHTEQIYAAIFEDQGFQNIQIERVRKRTSKKELFEYDVSARAPS
jgi:hypothetical protein